MTPPERQIQLLLCLNWKRTQGTRLIEMNSLEYTRMNRHSHRDKNLIETLPKAEYKVNSYRIIVQLRFGSG